MRILALALTATAALLFAGASPAQQVTSHQIPVPVAPTGWASWNAFAAKVDCNIIKRQADAFVAAGLPEAGWWTVSRPGA